MAFHANRSVVAGKRGLDDDERGQLIYKFVELAHRMRGAMVCHRKRPRTHRKRCFRPILCVYDRRDLNLAISDVLAMRASLAREIQVDLSIAWRVFDARYFGVAQRRRRVWIVGHIGERLATT